MKIFKYIKFIFCLTIIVSLVAPSYAALSSTDGSLFITKDEFDSAMVDFNSRLTTFEASINSKVDSQITSYLDRNGIWNANAIVFTEGTVKEPTMADFGGNLGAWENTTKKVVRFVGECNKSGLAYININMDLIRFGAGNDAWRPYLRIQGGQWDGFETMMYLSLVGGQYAADGVTEEQLYSSLISKSRYNAHTDNNFSASSLVLPFPTAGKWSPAFFVRPGKIWVGFDVKRLSANGSAPRTCGLDCWTNGKMVVTITNAEVY